MSRNARVEWHLPPPQKKRLRRTRYADTFGWCTESRRIGFSIQSYVTVNFWGKNTKKIEGKERRHSHNIVNISVFFLFTVFITNSVPLVTRMRGLIKNTFSQGKWRCMETVRRNLSLIVWKITLIIKFIFYKYGYPLLSFKFLFIPWLQTLFNIRIAVVSPKSRFAGI